MGEGWRKVKPTGFYWLTVEAPLELRWRWRKWKWQGRNKLLLQSPRGALWLFKMVGGIYLRPLNIVEQGEFLNSVKKGN